ncbi:L-arabinose transport system permease protein AraP [Pseudoruegeria aquimaris]|uniref:L-arabinose transport system permease protein AraP n=1 Tax=Pseudoruegeria aquimaris TaxID=393663 RepID=A0A1Y5RLW1_9RHOB|nr:sugar ABC transporter permease [Pseudoruegeria aquimaris]SLN19450.1 L-arabinose transport system permease protein AraP [Pseudoruegeria aquimaris]
MPGRYAHLWFIGPALVLMLAILVLPILVAFGLSFTDYGLGNGQTDFVGLDNYTAIFHKRSFAKMFGATFRYVLVVAPVSVALGLGAALMVNSLGRIGEIYKTIYFLPVMAALIAMAIVWELALHPELGVVNRLLATGCGSPLELWPWYAQGCTDGFPFWLNDKRYAIWTVAFIGVWQAFGFNMVLYLAGLTSVPRDLYHAAEMDGAMSSWERFRLVTWPALGPTTVFVVTITLIRSFQVFDTVEAFYPTGGGPSKSAYVMMFAIYEKGIQQNLLGLGAALTMVFLGFVMILTLAQRWLVERRVHY